jgi:hypothetical protein
MVSLGFGFSSTLSDLVGGDGGAEFFGRAFDLLGANEDPGQFGQETGARL